MSSFFLKLSFFLRKTHIKSSHIQKSKIAIEEAYKWVLLFYSFKSKIKIFTEHVCWGTELGAGYTTVINSGAVSALLELSQVTSYYHLENYSAQGYVDVSVG